MKVKVLREGEKGQGKTVILDTQKVFINEGLKGQDQLAVQLSKDDYDDNFYCMDLGVEFSDHVHIMSEGETVDSYHYISTKGKATNN